MINVKVLLLRKTAMRILFNALSIGLVFTTIGAVAHAQSSQRSELSSATATEWTESMGLSGDESVPSGIDIIALSKKSPSEWRNLLRCGQAPTKEEMNGYWRGLNSGRVPQRFGFSQFIKELDFMGPTPHGRNILVEQQPVDCLPDYGWQPKIDAETGEIKRHGSFVFLPPDHRGQYGHAARTSYREGDNPRLAPNRFLLNRIVKLDDDHLLGQATVKVGRVHIIVGYFFLERIPAAEMQASN